MSNFGLAASTVVTAFIGLVSPHPAVAQQRNADRAPYQLGVAVSGVVEAISVRTGDNVAIGQPLLKINCAPLEAEVSLRESNLAASQAAFERARNGSRPDEIAIGEAGVGVARARAEEARAAFERTNALREGVSTTRVVILQAQRDARITAAQLEDAKRKLDLLRAGSRSEDIREAEARRNAAAAALKEAQAHLDQCTVRAPAAGTVEVLATPGQFVSTAVPVTLLRLTPSAER